MSTVVTHQSWLGRLMGAVKGIVVGLVLFIAAFPLLFWNEGRAVKRHKTLVEGAAAVVSAPSDVVEPVNDGKLVHVTGRAETTDTLQDDVFGVSAQALKLDRIVEMYQWEESSHSKTKKKLGGGTETVETYNYRQTWSDRLIDSSRFNEAAAHRNPASIPYGSLRQTASPVTLGAYTLSASLVGEIDSYAPLALAADVRVPTRLGSKAKVFDGTFYIGDDPGSPQLGDVRVRFVSVAPTEVSVVAAQTGSTFEPYQTQAGGTVELLEVGTHSAAAMFQAAETRNRLLTWGLRLGGFIVMLFGLGLVFRPLSIVADVVPLFGNIVGAGTGTIAFLSAALLSLLTIAIAWVAYRPLLGITLFAAVAVLAVLVVKKLRSARAKKPTPVHSEAVPVA